ncbi:MAG: hypothetical protein M3357_12155 [Actinomycetota bacterium]|nr:hypothetical protein [Actinomycetota bacterium]
MDPDAGQEETTEPETEAAQQAMAGLRAIWMATGQMHEESVGLECGPEGEGCSASVGFEGLADTVEPTTDTADAIARLRSAWKATLAREGKLHDPQG